ncbi:MAG TPA: DMT family transporter [Acetobacteraceae bacterium]|nr:DMT family transporter [Acetobacteraceae bacterium]
MDRHTQGILLIILSAIAYSSAGFFTRLIHLDAWTMLFWRGLFAGLMIFCIIAIRERRRTWPAIRAIGRPGIAAALCSTAATIFYINALRHTSVADVAVLFAVAPFITAGLGWLWLGVREPWITLAASFIAVLGVSIMVGGAVIEGHLFGDLLGFGMALCMAIMMLIIRHHHETPMLPAACLSALLCPLLVWPFGSPFDVSAIDLLKLFLFGTTQFGLGLVFLTIGGQMVSATENALINTLETPLAVAWVWVCFAEIPTVTSFIGGIIVLLAVMGHVWFSGRLRFAAAAAVN